MLKFFTLNRSSSSSRESGVTKSVRFVEEMTDGKKPSKYINCETNNETGRVRHSHGIAIAVKKVPV